MHVTTFSLDHLGIVSGTYDELKVGSVIDESAAQGWAAQVSSFHCCKSNDS